MRWTVLLAIVVLVLAGVRAPLTAQPVPPVDGPRFTPDGKVIPPADYRGWVFVSTGFSMTYPQGLLSAGARAHLPLAVAAAGGTPVFQNVFVTPAAYRAFQQTGTWPDRTMFVLEIRSAKDKSQIVSGPGPGLSTGSVQGDLLDLEAELRDDARYPGTSWKWVTFDAGRGGYVPTQPWADDQPTGHACFQCHTAHGAVQKSMVEFYPQLCPLAARKNTLNPGFSIKNCSAPTD
ncbi:MAG TPA: cytochrome P460 family protein [Candidatus Sulfotelmatobacter sp.]|nr:cytochrome P460 family protein [Candidatus Sulfotelmatobacter sp.]